MGADRGVGLVPVDVLVWACWRSTSAASSSGIGPMIRRRGGGPVAPVTGRLTVFRANVRAVIRIARTNEGDMDERR
jgi:hypothetical protein